MPSKSLVLGYHGCDLAIVNEVVNGKELKKSEKPYDWLGHGIYFWEDNPTRALQWAKHRAKEKNSSIKTPAVLGAVIDLGNCLNLIDARCLEIVSEAFNEFAAVCKKFDEPMPRNKGSACYLDCAVFQFLHSIRNTNSLKEYDSVRGFFSEGEPLYEGTQIHKQDHIQICVRNSQRISGYFIPRKLSS